MSWLVQCNQPFPLVNQRTAPTWDGGVNEDAEDQCIPTSVAMVVQYLTGIRIPPDSIKDAMAGQGYVGYTYLSQAQQFLKNWCSTNATLYNPTEMSNSTNTGLANIVWKYLYQTRPVLDVGLMNGIPHCRVITGLSDTTFYLADPWTGTAVTQTYQEVWSEFQGWLLGIDRSPCA